MGEGNCEGGGGEGEGEEGEGEGSSPDLCVLNDTTTEVEY